MSRLLQFKSIRTSLGFWFVIVASFPLIIVCGIIFYQGSNHIKQDNFHKLTAIRDLKVEMVNAWLKERIGGINTLSSDFEIRDLEKIILGTEPDQKKRIVAFSSRNRLKNFQNSYSDYSEIFIINPDTGIVKISTYKPYEGTDKSQDSYFTVPMQTGEIFIKDIYFSKTLNKPAMSISIPVKCLAHDGKHITGILVVRIDLEQSLFKLLLNRTGMGKTGETLIVNKDVVVLNNLRWHKNAPLKLKINSQPAVSASQGSHGIIETTDYRGEKVLAAYAHIPLVNWGFVAKQDLQEINAPVQMLMRNIFILFGISMVIVCLIAVLVSKRIAKPILEMAQVSKEIQKGNLAARIRLQSKNELGFLAETFNRMADTTSASIAAIKEGRELLRVERDALDNKVKERTLELKQELDERKKAEEALKVSLNEKEVLLREIHHRVKNNMQVIASLLRLQFGKIKDSKYAGMFKDSQNRIKSMALIHEQLYRSKDFSDIDFKEYVNSLVGNLKKSHNIDPGEITIEQDIVNISFDLENAIPCGLIINELVSNSLKHAFPDGKQGEIRITLDAITEDEFILTVSDDGIGIPEEFDFDSKKTLGLDLAWTIAEHQLKGEIKLDQTKGTTFHIRFKKQVYKKRI